MLDHSVIIERDARIPRIPEIPLSLIEYARNTPLPRQTVDGQPADSLHALYQQYEQSLHDALIAESERGIACRQLRLADDFVALGTAKNIIEAWIRADLQIQGEKAADRLLRAARMQAARVLLPMGPHDIDAGLKAKA